MARGKRGWMRMARSEKSGPAKRKEARMSEVNGMAVLLLLLAFVGLVWLARK